MAQPKRKAKPKLTLIPEEERAINYRFHVVVVGAEAALWSKMVVESEMAEAFRPKGKNAPKTETSAPDAAGGTQPDSRPESPSSLTVDPSSPLLDASSREQAEPKEKEDNKDAMVLFCPAGAVSKELVRLRLTFCCGFSDALPLTKDKTVAANMVVVFLFWRVEDQAREDRLSTTDTINDWRSRMAEINHQPQGSKPYVAVLAFEPSEGQETEIESFASKQPSKINVISSPDDSEETFIDSLQTVVEGMIARAQSTGNDRSSGRVSSAAKTSIMGTSGTDNQVQKAACCTVS